MTESGPEQERRAMVQRLQRYVRQLERANAEHERFAEIVSHDLRTPLRGLGQLVGWLREDLGHDLAEPASRHLELIEERVERTRNLLDDLLAYARAGHGAGRPELLELSRVVAQVTALVRTEDGPEVQIEGPLPILECPRVPLKTVLGNLIGNAMQHAGPGRTVTVRARPVDEGTTRIEVADDGPGIDPAHHVRIFDAFRTLAPAEDGKVRGMGLAIVKKIVEGMGGDVGVTSAPGEGACFWFTWPTRVLNTDLVGDETRDLIADAGDVLDDLGGD